MEWSKASSVSRLARADDVMASIVDILCSEQHEPVAREPQAPRAAVCEQGGRAMDEPALGKPPAALNGARRKSGWGKRFKEREQGRLAIIFPRRKMGEAARGSDAVWLSVDVLNSLADRSLASAAKLLVSSRTPVCTLCVVPSTGFNAPLWRAREPPLCAPCSNRRKVSAGAEPSSQRATRLLRRGSPRPR